MEDSVLIERSRRSSLRTWHCSKDLKRERLSQLGTHLKEEGPSKRGRQVQRPWGGDMLGVALLTLFLCYSSPLLSTPSSCPALAGLANPCPHPQMQIWTSCNILFLPRLFSHHVHPFISIIITSHCTLIFLTLFHPSWKWSHLRAGCHIHLWTRGA